MKLLFRSLVGFLILLPVVSAGAGWFLGPAALHPLRRPLSLDLVAQAKTTLSQVGAKSEGFDVRAPDGILLRGWKLRAARPNGDWVLLFHGVADNRMGVIGQATILLQAGYNVVMMDARAHGDSGGELATYGWKERSDTHAIVDALVAADHPQHLFALGESMGAGIALQSAAADLRIEAVVAEAAFASLREASYDYAGLQRFPWLGRTLFRPGAWAMVYHCEKEAGFLADEISPEKAVAARRFPVLLICDAGDTTLPCRHSLRIYSAARGPKQLWIVPGAFHAAAFGYAPAEFRDRVLAFLGSAQSSEVKTD
jgi:alpha-beta hydrolase superfamily lysophospholipase